MRSKLAFSVFVAASLFGATTLASAQTAAGRRARQIRRGYIQRDGFHAPSSPPSPHDSMGYSRAQMDKSRPGGRPISRKAAD